jgi:L-aminopeptidase/D-esterase-like protein
VAGLKAGGLTDVPGLKVGHYTDPRRPTGCTVVLCEEGAVCGVDVRGGAPGTRETDLLRSENTVEHVHAVLLTGGSAFGLAAATGVVQWLEERGHGLQVGPAKVPLVPSAVLFDLWVGDHRIRPDAEAGRAACEAATTGPVAEGNVGAGAGAAVGKLFGIRRAMKGGIGTASVRLGGFTVAVLVAVNAVGDVLGENGQVLAGARDEEGLRMVGTTAAVRAVARSGNGSDPRSGAASASSSWRSRSNANRRTPRSERPARSKSARRPSSVRLCRSARMARPSSRSSRCIPSVGTPA